MASGAPGSLAASPTFLAKFLLASGEIAYIHTCTHTHRSLERVIERVYVLVCLCLRLSPPILPRRRILSSGARGIPKHNSPEQSGVPGAFSRVSDVDDASDVREGTDVSGVTQRERQGAQMLSGKWKIISRRAGALRFPAGVTWAVRAQEAEASLIDGAAAKTRGPKIPINALISDVCFFSI